MSENKLDITFVPLYNRDMDIIIDSSCIMAVLLDEEKSVVVKRATKGANLISAACLPYEVANSLTSSVKRHRITAELALNIYKEFLKIPVRLIEPDISKAIKIATEEKNYAYDALYIACALDMGAVLYSLDYDMIEIAKRRGVTCW